MTTESKALMTSHDYSFDRKSMTAVLAWLGLRGSAL